MFRYIFLCGKKTGFWKQQLLLLAKIFRQFQELWYMRSIYFPLKGLLDQTISLLRGLQARFLPNEHPLLKRRVLHRPKQCLRRRLQPCTKRIKYLTLSYTQIAFPQIWYHYGPFPCPTLIKVVQSRSEMIQPVFNIVFWRKWEVFEVASAFENFISKLIMATPICVNIFSKIVAAEHSSLM